MAGRDVEPGENYQEAIVRAIRAAKVMVLVFTDNANNSAEIKKELALASHYNTMVIPARVEDILPSEAFAYELATRQWIDLFDNWEEEMERLTVWIAKSLAVDIKTGTDRVPLRRPQVGEPEIGPQPPAPQQQPAPTSASIAEFQQPPVRPPAPVKTLASAPASVPYGKAENAPVKPSPLPGRQPSPAPENIPLAAAENTDAKIPVPVEKPTPPENSALPDRQHGNLTGTLSALAIICGAAALFAVMLGGHGPVPALRAWNSALLVAIPVLALIAMTSGLALFYGANTESRSTLTALLTTIGIAAAVWVVGGYSLAFTGGSDFIGSTSKFLLANVTSAARATTNNVGVDVSEFSYVVMQGCFAAIAPALVVGMLAKRTRFAAIVLFVPIWTTLIYLPIAHMVWYWSGPDAVSDAAKALAAAGDALAKTAAQAKLDEINADAGWLYQKGLIDSAGGSVVAIVAGITGLTMNRMLCGRNAKGDRRELDSLSTAGAASLLLMWLAWFGLNAVSTLDFGDRAVDIVMANSFWASGAAALAGLSIEWVIRGQPSLRGVLYGTLAGIVAITAGSQYAGPGGALFLGLVAGALAEAAVNASRRFGLGASAELPVIYLCGGVVGTLVAAILVNPSLGGTGVMDYTIGKIADYDLASQLISQGWGVTITLLWAGLGSFVVFKLLELIVGLRPTAKV
jgi:ammonium transporter, Amt family